MSDFRTVVKNPYYGVLMQENYFRGSNISSDKKKRFQKGVEPGKNTGEKQSIDFHERTEKDNWEWIFTGENLELASVNPLFQNGQIQGYELQIRF